MGEQEEGGYRWKSDETSSRQEEKAINNKTRKVTTTKRQKTKDKCETRKRQMIEVDKSLLESNATPISSYVYYVSFYDNIKPWLYFTFCRKIYM